MRSNSSSLVDGTVLEGLGMTWMEEVCHYGRALRFKKPPHQAQSLFTPCLWIRYQVSAIAPVPCLPAAMLPSMMTMNSHAETVSKP